MSNSGTDQTAGGEKNNHVIEMHDVLTDSESEPSTIVVTDSETARDPDTPNEKHSKVVCKPQMCTPNSDSENEIQWIGTYYRSPVFTIEREPRAGFCQRLLNSMGFRLSDRELKFNGFNQQKLVASRASSYQIDREGIRCNGRIVSNR